MSLARDRSTAEDLVQETYLRALSARRRADPAQNLRGWLFTILHNVWRNEVRRPRLEPLGDVSRPARGADVVWLARASDPEVELERGRLIEALRNAIEDLPEHFRAVVVLRGIEGFSYQEIASILGCPTGTVMSRLARGRALVRQRLAAPASRFAREAGR
jgi:RNA polymerase sigma-70 factor (ECF subfamily)